MKNPKNKIDNREFIDVNILIRPQPLKHPKRFRIDFIRTKDNKCLYTHYSTGMGTIEEIRQLVAFGKRTEFKIIKTDL